MLGCVSFHASGPSKRIACLALGDVLLAAANRDSLARIYELMNFWTIGPSANSKLTKSDPAQCGIFLWPEMSPLTFTVPSPTHDLFVVLVVQVSSKFAQKPAVHVIPAIVGWYVTAVTTKQESSSRPTGVLDYCRLSLQNSARVTEVESQAIDI